MSESRFAVKNFDDILQALPMELLDQCTAKQHVDCLWFDFVKRMQQALENTDWEVIPVRQAKTCLNLSRIDYHQHCVDPTLTLILWNTKLNFVYTNQKVKELLNSENSPAEFFTVQTSTTQNPCYVNLTKFFKEAGDEVWNVEGIQPFDLKKIGIRSPPSSASFLFSKKPEAKARSEFLFKRSPPCQLGLKLVQWPTSAKSILTRNHPSGWPGKVLLNQVEQQPILLKFDQDSREDQNFVISMVFVEDALIQSFSPNFKRAYMVSKAIFDIEFRSYDFPEYLFNHCVFWALADETKKDVFEMPIDNVVIFIFNKIARALKLGKLFNFFFPKMEILRKALPKRYKRTKEVLQQYVENFKAAVFDMIERKKPKFYDFRTYDKHYLNCLRARELSGCCRSPTVDIAQKRVMHEEAKSLLSAALSYDPMEAYIVLENVTFCVVNGHDDEASRILNQFLDKARHETLLDMAYNKYTLVKVRDARAMPKDLHQEIAHVGELYLPLGLYMTYIAFSFLNLSPQARDALLFLLPYLERSPRDVVRYRRKNHQIDTLCRQEAVLQTMQARVFTITPNVLDARRRQIQADREALESTLDEGQLMRKHEADELEREEKERRAPSPTFEEEFQHYKKRARQCFSAAHLLDSSNRTAAAGVEREASEQATVVSSRRKLSKQTPSETDSTRKVMAESLTTKAPLQDSVVGAVDEHEVGGNGVRGEFVESKETQREVEVVVPQQSFTKEPKDELKEAEPKRSEVQQQKPKVESTLPDVKQKQSEAELERPEAEQEQPAVEQRQPKAEQEQSEVKQKQSGVEQKQSGVEQKQSEVEEEQPKANQQPETEKKPPETAADQKPEDVEVTQKPDSEPSMESQAKAGSEGSARIQKVTQLLIRCADRRDVMSRTCKTLRKQFGPDSSSDHVPAAMFSDIATAMLQNIEESGILQSGCALLNQILASPRVESLKGKPITLAIEVLTKAENVSSLEVLQTALYTLCYIKFNEIVTELNQLESVCTLVVLAVTKLLDEDLLLKEDYKNGLLTLCENISEIREHSFKQTFLSSGLLTAVLRWAKTLADQKDFNPDLTRCWSVLLNLSAQAPEISSEAIQKGADKIIIKAFAKWSLRQDCQDFFKVSMNFLFNAILDFEIRQRVKENQELINASFEMMVQTRSMSLGVLGSEVFALLLMDPEENWPQGPIRRMQVEMKMVQLVPQWPIPKHRRVKYITFAPQCQLFRSMSSVCCSLIAAWVLANCVVTDQEEYCKIIKEENILPLLEEVLERPNSLKPCKELITKTIDFYKAWSNEQ